ncbi:MAG: hypothetical protein F4W90_03480 [Gammaproteobacteria bacterium]|nr:hypothetical protein [Gammaproteobacteria bacterium]
MSVSVYAGTVGWGVWRSDDLGESWRFAFEGLPVEMRTWSMSSHPQEPGVVWAGTDIGLLRQDADGRGHRVASPADGKQIWSVTQAVDDPKEIYIGTNPGAIYRSLNEGDSWDQLPIDLVEECPIGKPRITRIRFDPLDSDTIWASAEIDAVHRSRDRGETWERSEEGFRFPDIHDIAIAAVDAKRKLLTATALGLYESFDDAATWTWRELDSPWQYTRGIKPKADLDGTVFLCNGNGPPGSTGRLLRSRDWGATWEDCELPGNVNSTPWMVADNSADPNLLFCCTNLGQMYRSQDGGEDWTKLDREFGEIRTMLWHPN